MSKLTLSPAARPWSIARRVLVLGAMTITAGCGSSQSRPADTIYLSDDERSEAERFMPLEEGTVYAYDTRTAKGEPGVMTIQVKRAKTGEIDLVVGGRTEHLAARSDGIRYASGGYYLKSPLTADNVWEGRFGLVRVHSTEEAVKVPAGEFKGCLQTVEEARRLHAHQTITSTYCPHVGLVLLDIGYTGKGHETAALRSFGPRFDPMINDEPEHPDQ
jgi:hypothetical protein